MSADTISIQKKSLALQYTNDKRTEKETRETPPLTIATNKIKYLGIMLTKEAKDLYEKNFKCLKKEIEDDTRKWKDHLCSWKARINILKMNILLQQSIDSVKITSQFFTDLEKIRRNFTWKKIPKTA